MKINVLIYIGLFLMISTIASSCGLFLHSMEAMTGDDWGADERQTNYRQEYAAEESKNYMENTNCRQNGLNCIK